MSDKIFILPAVIVCMGLTLTAPRVVFAQEAAEDDDGMKVELQYIEALQEAGYPDFAESVIASVKAKYPAAAAHLKVLEMKGELALGRFAVVQKALDAMPNKNGAEYWALNLAMADTYYAVSNMKACEAIYRAFFDKFQKPPKELETFYLSSAYRWASMLQLSGRVKESIAMYQKLLQLPMQDYIRRNITTTVAELMIQEAENSSGAAQKKELNDAEKLVGSLLWKQDVWFGKAVVMKAHIALLRGDVKGAQDLVEDYMPTLRTLHEQLKEQDPDGSMGMMRASPMPQCRYLLAKLLWEEAQAEAKKAKPNEDKIKAMLFGERVGAKRNGRGAFNHAINVFAQHPESSWASDAGRCAEAISAFVKERYNTEVKANITPNQMAEVRRKQFFGAQTLLGQNKFAAAVEQYLTVLNQFPEEVESIRALNDLATCYLQLMQEQKDAAGKTEMQDNFDAVVGYLAERFSGRPSFERIAGDALLSLGAELSDRKDTARAKSVYALYFANYPRHYAVPQQAYLFATRAFEAESYKDAEAYCEIITTNWTNATDYCTSAYGLLARVYKTTGDQVKEIDALNAFAKITKSIPQKLQARFALANVQRDRGVALLKSAETNIVATAEGDETNAVAAVAAMRVQAVTSLLNAAKVFKELAMEAEAAMTAPAVGSDDKKEFMVVRENAMYMQGICCMQMTYPKDKISTYRTLACKALEAYIEAYPQGKYAPRTYVQLGTLYMTMNDAEKSQAMFATLAKEFPQSTEAKNAVPLQAKALIEMDLPGEAVVKYRQMLSTADGAYTATQFLEAGDTLLMGREYNVALQAYDKVLAKLGKTGSITQVASAKLGRARALYGAKKYAEAHEALDAFLADARLSKLTLMVDANLLLVDVASEEGRTEKNDELRIRAFNAAVNALKAVRKYWRTPAQLADLEVRSGEVLLRRMDAEKTLGLTAQVDETRGLAIVAFQSILMTKGPTEDHPFDTIDKTSLPFLEQAYYRCLPLMLERGAMFAADVVQYGEDYLKYFPNGKYRTEVQTWVNQAKIDIEPKPASAAQ